MTEPVINLQISDGIATIFLNRPDMHNALNAEMIDTLLNILSDLEVNKSVRTVVLTTKGSNFCAGADLNLMKEISDEQNYSFFSLQLAELMSTLDNLSKPTLAFVRGAVYGGGIGLVACCDIALASQNTHFCFSEVRLGLIPSVISPYVIKAIGARAARRYLLTAEKLSAKQACSIGLIHEVLVESELQSRASEISQNLILGGPSALARTKLLIKDVSQSKLDWTLIDDSITWLNETRKTVEAKEGINAFFDKRAANWVNIKKD